MIGAYMAYALAPIVGGTFGGGFFATLAVGVVLAVIMGYVLEWAFFSFLYEREHLQQVLMTYGLILVFEELRSLLVGDDSYGVQAPEWLSGTLPLGEMMTYPVYRLFISGVCLALAAGMYFVFTRTRLGMMIRAGSTNREMVQSLGIDIKFLYRVVFAAGMAIAGGHGGGTRVVGVPRHGQLGADYLFCGGGDWWHWLHSRGVVGCVADWCGGHIWQGAATASFGCAGVCADGTHPALETRRTF
jgi:branched-subunit amino acid ABC-type transport system permease component